MTRLLSSHRCSALREIYLRDCEIPEESMKALAMNSCETLESIVIEERRATQVIPFPTMCHHASFIQFGDQVTEIEMIGKENIKSPSRTIEFLQRSTER